MGRSLFSARYNAAPAVRTEPERVPDHCEKWSVWNKFDPDSDEFFENAVDEAFTDLDAARQHQQEAEEIVAEVRRATVVYISPETSESSDSGDSDAGSPMLVGSNDPTVLAAQTMPVPAPQWRNWETVTVDTAERREWQPLTRRVPTIGYNPDNTADRPDLNHIVSATRSNRYSRVRTVRNVPIPAVFPPSNVVSSTIPSDIPVDAIQEAPQALVTVAASPAVVQARPRSPGPAPIPIVAPSTPQARVEDHSLVSPSPPGSVTPARPYSWMESAHWHPVPSAPASPTRPRAGRDGPLTNPRARVSYARITTVPAPLLVVQDVN